MARSSTWNGLTVAGFIVGGIGAVFMIAGVLIRTYSPGAIMARHDRMQALTSPPAATINDMPPQQEVLVDGHIADDQPVLFRDFVAKAESFGTRTQLLEEDKSHEEINKELGADAGYTAQVEAFLRSLDPSIAELLGH